MAESAGTLAEAFVRIRSDDSMARAGMSKFRGKFSTQMAGLRKMAVITLSVVGLGAGIRGVFNFGKSLVMAGDQIESLRNSFATMLKTKGLSDAAGQADDLIDKARKFTAVTPFTEEMTSKAVSAFLPFSNNMDDLFEKITSIGEAASVSAEGLQAFPRISRGISQMFAKSKIQAEEMMQLAEAGIPAWQTLAKAMGMSVAEVMEISQKGELGMDAINKFVKQLGSDFAGNMAKQAQTVGGLTTTITDTVRAKMVQAMAPIRDLVQQSFSKIAEFVQSDKFAGVMERVKGIISDIAGAIRKAFESPLAKAAMKFGAIAIAANVAVGLFFAMKAAILAAFAMVAPFLPAMIAIGAAAIAFKTAWDAAMSSDKAEAIKQDLRDIWNNLKLIWENVKTTFGNMAKTIGEAFGGTGDGIRDKIGGAVEWVTDKLNTLTTWIGVLSSNWQATWDIMKLSVRISLLEIKQQFLAAVQGMVGVFGYLATNWQRVLATVIDMATITWGAIGAGLSAAFQAIEWGRLGDAFGNLVKIWLAHSYGLITGLAKVFSWIFENFKDLVERMIKIWFNLSTMIPKLIAAAIKAGLGKGTLGENITDVLSDVFDGVGDLFEVGMEAAGEFKDGYEKGSGEAREFLGVTQGIGESLGEIGSQMGTAARAAVGGAMAEISDRITRMKSEISNIANAYEAARTKAMEDGVLSVDEQKILDAAKAEIAMKTAALKEEYDKRRKALEDQKKAGKEANKGTEDAAEKWGDEADKAADAADEAEKAKSTKSESVGIEALQKKMQDIFGGADTQNPVVKAVNETNKKLADIGKDVKNIAGGNAGGVNGGNAGDYDQSGFNQPHSPITQEDIDGGTTPESGNSFENAFGIMSPADIMRGMPPELMDVLSTRNLGSGMTAADLLKKTRGINVPQPRPQSSGTFATKEMLLEMGRQRKDANRQTDKVVKAIKENKPVGTAP